VAQGVEGLKLEVVSLPGRTPIIFGELAADAGCEDAGTVLLYGHLDKQPPFTGWDEGVEPYVPLIKDGKLYGRGGADDGYAIFSAVTALKALQLQGVPRARCVIIIEACEESGSPDLPYHIENLKTRIGDVNFIICLDSGCGNYDQMWVTTSLRGIVAGVLKVAIVKEGVHSGASTGIVPDSFRIIREVLDRIEDCTTGIVKPKELYAEIPAQRVAQAAKTSAVLGESIVQKYPFVDGASAVATTPPNDLGEALLNLTWRPQLAITGAEGLPTLVQAGNVLRPSTALKISMRVPPAVDAPTASAHLKRILEANPPYNAEVTYTEEKKGSGWDAPALAGWLEDAAEEASTTFYEGKSALYQGEGGSIPFMGMLGKMFPTAQFLITGVLGPASNAHGPNEFLHIDYSKRLTCCIASILMSHGKASAGGAGAGGEPAAKRVKPSPKELTEHYGREADGTKL
jgi:acetylornithine deacetylase/succinyl-diaminopimelate desuccinylase-like protein